MKLLLTTVEEADIQEFFFDPVTDEMAPGYSEIITHPMDLTTGITVHSIFYHTLSYSLY